MGGNKGERKIGGNKGETGLGEIQGVRERQSDGRVQKAIVMIENSKLHFTLVQIITNIRIKTFWIYNLFACIMCAHICTYLVYINFRLYICCLYFV